MSLRAVVDYTAGLLQGQAYGNFEAADVWTEFEAREQAGERPQIWIVPSFGDNRRMYPPRGYGWRELNYRLQIRLEIIFRPDDHLLSVRDLVSGIMGTLRSSPLPVDLIDAETGEKSVLMTLGEQMDWTMETPVSTKSQRLTGYNAAIQAEVIEFVVG